MTILLSLLSTQFSAGDASESDSPSSAAVDDVGDAVRDTAAAAIADVDSGVDL